jgi:hypothetical protein
MSPVENAATGVGSKTENRNPSCRSTITMCPVTNLAYAYQLNISGSTFLICKDAMIHQVRNRTEYKQSTALATLHVPGYRRKKAIPAEVTETLRQEPLRAESATGTSEHWLTDLRLF